MNLTVGELKALFPGSDIRVADDVVVSSISHDSRKMTPGCLYVAIKGENFDGHDFVEAAFAAGAALTLVNRSVAAKTNQLVCDDTVLGLGKIANFYRQKFSQPVVAITGSSGKTTTKEWLTHVLSGEGLVVATKGNLNNHIGVPDTIFTFDFLAKYFVVEMGMNHFEEIRHLAKITEPSIALITNVGPAHIGNLGGTLAGVAQAKGELFAELSELATAIVNLDDPHIASMPTSARRVTYSLSVAADYQASDVVVSDGKTSFVVTANGQKTPVTIQLAGDHQIHNALSVFAVAGELGLPHELIAERLSGFELTMNRGRVLSWQKATLVDDTYNANPSSMIAAFDALTKAYPLSRRFAVLGGMLELGENSTSWHRNVGEQARLLGVHELFVYGGDAAFYLDGFGYTAGEAKKHIFADHESLAEALRAAVEAASGSVAVLFKGSRGMAMEKAIAAFAA